MTIPLILGVISAVAVWVFLFKLFFDDIKEFAQCMKSLCVPSFRGEWLDNPEDIMKVFLWFFSGVIVGLAVGFGVYKLFATVGVA